MLGPPGQWPAAQARASYDSLYRIPLDNSELLFEIAMCQLEIGQSQEAAESLKKLLKTYPDTNLRRLVRFYLFHATGEEIDPEGYYI